MSAFTQRQRDALLSPIHGERVHHLDGQSHLAAWDVVAHLNRLFGFEGWDKEILSLELVYEHVGQRTVNQGKNNERQVPACSVGYRCTMRLTVRNPEGETVRVVEDAAMGTATNQRDLGDAHDLALKSAVSYAVKRCAKDLGDQFGLSLYNKGQQTGCVGSVLPYLGERGEHSYEVKVEADGIAEGDEGFGASRGEQADPEPVREPEPAKAKPAPEPEAPAEKPAPPVLTDADQQTWVDTIASISDAEALRRIWREADAKRLLDSQIFVDPGDGSDKVLTTIRERIVARLNEIEQEAS